MLGLGCWTLGDRCWGPVDEAAGIATIRRAVERGINWFDTAPIYGDGQSDRLLAKALGPWIHNVVIATKVGVRANGHSDLRPEHIVDDCEQSLRRLREPLDLLQVHWPCERGTALSDTLGALEALKQRGWIRHYGLCNYDAATVRKASGIVSLQTPYSLVRRDFERELQKTCQQVGVGVLAYEAQCRGLLSGKYRQPPEFEERDIRANDLRFQGRFFQHATGVAGRLAAVGERLGVSASAVALGWVARQPGVTSVIAGARSAGQVDQNARAAALIDRDNIWRVVDRVL